MGRDFDRIRICINLPFDSGLYLAIHRADCFPRLEDIKGLTEAAASQHRLARANPGIAEVY